MIELNKEETRRPYLDGHSTRDEALSELTNDPPPK